MSEQIKNDIDDRVNKIKGGLQRYIKDLVKDYEIDGYLDNETDTIFYSGETEALRISKLLQANSAAMDT